MKKKILNSIKNLNIFSTLCKYVCKYVDKDIISKKRKITGFKIANKTVGQRIVGYFFTKFIEYDEEEKCYVKKKKKN